MSIQLRWSIIKEFSGGNTLSFTFQDVEKLFPKKNRIFLAKVLAEMVENGLIGKVARNNYHIIPFNADPETYKPNELQVAKYLMSNKEYYIGYASAMKVHGLSPQSELLEYVVTKTQIKPSIKQIRGITYQFVQHDTARFFGFESMWINQFEEASVSDLEKTMVDIATKPQLCGGIIEVGKFLTQSHARIDHNKLFYYFARNRNKSAKKRFLFLTDLLNMEWTDDHHRMKEELGSGFSLLDPSATDQGKKRKHFGLKVNVDSEHIKKQVLIS
jgi:predicted transcriptional regulator of viral defense system